jgi:predicted Zn-dependent peptidase
MTGAIIRMAGFLVFAAACHAELKLPPYSVETLPNGTTVFVMQRAGVPLVEIEFAVRGGKESEPIKEPGMAAITADLLRKGSDSYTSNEFSLALDALGASYRVRTDEQVTMIESEFLAKDLGQGLSLISQAVLHPTFPEAEVAKLLGQRRDDIKSLKDDPAHAIASYAHAFFFGEAHPYGRIIDEESVSRITRAAIAEYYKRMYVGKNLIVAIVGDIEPESAMKIAREKLRGIPAGSAFAWRRDIALPHRSTNRLLLVDKPGATQSYFYIVQPGIDAKNPDRVAIRLVNTLFGGRFTSMLNEELRIKTGLSYGARNAIETNRLQGMNAISTYTKTESTEQALDLSLTTLNELRSRPITEAQLASAKAYLKGMLPRQLMETGDQLARELIRLDVLGLGRDEIDTLFERIGAVSMQQASAVTQKYFVTTGLTFVVVGDASKIRGKLTKFAPRVEEVPIFAPGFGPS